MNWPLIARHQKSVNHIKRSRSAVALALAIALLFLTAPSAALAGILPSCASKDGGCDTLDSLIQVGVNYGRFVLGLSGSIALLMFIYGGFYLLSSAGTPARVEKGRNIIIAATIGLIIIFSAFTAVKFMLRVLDPTGTYDLYVTKTR